MHRRSGMRWRSVTHLLNLLSLDSLVLGCLYFLANVGTKAGLDFLRLDHELVLGLVCGSPQTT